MGEYAHFAVRKIVVLVPCDVAADGGMPGKRCKVYAERYFFNRAGEFRNRVPIDIDGIHISPFVERTERAIEERRQGNAVRAADYRSDSFFQVVFLCRIGKEGEHAVRMGVRAYEA